MSTPRPLPAIQAEIAALLNLLETLAAERAASRARRRAGIVADFDAGLCHRAIAAKWEVPYGAVAVALHRAGRNHTARRRADLAPAQRPHFDKLLRQGTPSRLAHAIARTVAAPEAP